jgi:anaerobic selenocysteine-containing dehydrogenase
MTRTIRRSTCNRDCPDACGLIATVVDGRLTSLTGDPSHPVTRGFLCYRTSRFPALQSAPHRLRQPLLRQNGSLRPVSLDTALDVAADRLGAIRAESGPAAIFHYRSGGSLGLLKLLADRLFEQLGPCTTKIGDICSGAGEAAQELDFGISDSNDLLDLRHSRHVLLWGKNPFVSNIHLIPLLREARARGARVALIDPVRHKGESLADSYVQPRPGTDFELALGVARLLFDSGRIDVGALASCDHVDEFRALAHRRSVDAVAAFCDVPRRAIEELAAVLVDGPTAILIGWGLQRRLRGAATVRALDALSAVSGNLFRPGGGASFYFKRRGPFATDALLTGRAPRRIREPMFGHDVLAAHDPPIRAIWITAGNPVCMLPDSARVAAALERTEFVVVVDPFLTDTGRRADLVLPVPTLLEDDDLLGAYGHHWLSESRPLIDPPEGVCSELELLQRLAERLGVGAAMAGSADDWKRRLLARTAEHGVTLEHLRQHGATRNPQSPEVLFGEGRVRTPSGAVNLIDAPPADPAPDDPAFPLWLFSNSTVLAQSSQWARDPGPRITVTVHPDSAPGHRDGDEVAVESRAGRLLAVLAFDAGQRRDVAIVPKGGHFDLGHAANALIEARPTDLGLGAAYLDCQVRIVTP